MLSTKQQEYLLYCNHRWNLKIGATGSGKSWLDYAVVIPKRLQALKGQGAAVMLGNTQGTISRNVLDPMREIWGADLVGTISSDNTAVLFGQKVHILGADNKKHVARLQGMTIEYAYGDEMTTWNQEVFEMLKSRLRCQHSYFDGTANPADPHHFIKKFIDSDADVYCQTSTIDDNPFLPVEFVEDLKKEYAGTIYYLRFIKGQWAAAQGIIFRAFADAIAQKDTRFFWPPEKDLKPWRVHIGIDFGGNGSQHAMVAVGILPGYQGVIGLQSVRIPPAGGDADVLARQFIDFCTAIFSRWGEIHNIYCDSAEQVLINHLRSAASSCRLSWLADRIHNARKAPINDRIRLTSILMSSGRFWVLQDTTKSLQDALSEALWDDKKHDDTRLDDGTSDIDTLDAYEYTIERDAHNFLRLAR